MFRPADAGQVLPRLDLPEDAAAGTLPMEIGMSNKSTLLAWVNGQDELACGAALELLGFTAQPSTGHDEPDSRGMVALTGLRPNHPRTGFRCYVKEVIDALPAGPAKDLGNANLRYVNALNMILRWKNSAARAGYIGSGDTAHVDPHSDNIPNSLVFAAKDARSDAPLLDTVQKATEFLDNMPDSAFGTPSGDSFHA
jgi:hypothetical protein